MKTGVPASDGSYVAYKNPFSSIIEFLESNERLFLEAIAVESDHAFMSNISKVLEVSPLQLSKICENIKHNALIRKNNEDGDVIYYFTHTKIRKHSLRIYQRPENRLCILKTLKCWKQVFLLTNT